MTAKRKVRIHGGHKVPIDEEAYIKIIRHYYSGPHKVIVHFDNRQNCWGGHSYVARSKTHHLYISPKWCTFNKMKDEARDFKKLMVTCPLGRMNDRDIVARVIHSTLHELKHAMQCDNNPIRYAKCTDDKHPNMKNSSLAYEFSPLEAEAEGWSLLHINRALERYESWCNG